MPKRAREEEPSRSSSPSCRCASKNKTNETQRGGSSTTTTPPTTTSTTNTLFRTVPATNAYRYLEPGPIVLVTSASSSSRSSASSSSSSRTGTSGSSSSSSFKYNIMTMGFHMMITHVPALVGAVIGPWDYTHRAIRESGRCVLAIPPASLAETVIKIGNCSGSRVDKFAKFSLTPLEVPVTRGRRGTAAAAAAATQQQQQQDKAGEGSSKRKNTRQGSSSSSSSASSSSFSSSSSSVSTPNPLPPLVRECPINMECQLHDTTLAEQYNLLILKVTRIWVDREARFITDNMSSKKSSRDHSSNSSSSSDSGSKNRKERAANETDNGEDDDSDYDHSNNNRPNVVRTLHHTGEGNFTVDGAKGLNYSHLMTKWMDVD